jgi:hypothetical protein
LYIVVTKKDGFGRPFSVSAGRLRMIFPKSRGISPWRSGPLAVEGAAMTRPSIELCIKVFIVALILTFGWTVTKVLAQIGWP